MKRNLPLVVGLLSASVSTASLHASDHSISLHPKLYPDGLYSGQAPRDPSPLAPMVGGYDVLTSLTGVTGLRTDAAQGSSSQGNYEFSNLRIASAQTTFEDYLIGYYSFDLATQRLSPIKFEKAPGVGIYEAKDSILLKDSPGSVNFYTNPATPTQFSEGTLYTFQSSTDYFSNLVAGQRMCVVLTNLPLNTTLRIIFTMQDGTSYAEEAVTTPSGTVTLTLSQLPILVTGTYRMRLEPVAPTAAFSYKIRFYNENASTTVTTSSGNTLSASLAGSGGGTGLPYKKYKIALTNGQTVNLPADLDTNISLINSRGVRVGGGSNSGLSDTVTETGDYYIVITPRENINGATETYTGLLAISSGLTFLNWSSAHSLKYGRDGYDQDSDRDGVSNIVEYALGLDPNRSEVSPLAITLSQSQATLNFPRPDYLQGVSVQARFSPDGINWTNAASVSAGTVPGQTLMTASATRTGRAFARLEVQPVN